MDWPISWNDVKEALDNAGGGLPVVELTTEPTMEGVSLTESESAAVSAAHATGMPAVVKFTLTGNTNALIAGWVGNGYVITYLGLMFVISSDDNVSYTFSIEDV